jgi:dsRNA-specific ribonuclease
VPVSEHGNLSSLAKKLGLEKEDLLGQALAHPSKKRLAWLGDAVLCIAVTEHQFRTSNAPRSKLDPERQETIRNLTLKKTAAEKLFLNELINVKLFFKR